MFKSKKGAALIEVMIAIIISGITIASGMAFFVNMYKTRYFNIAHLYYLDFAISTLEYRKCYGENAVLPPAGGNQVYSSVGREATINATQEEWLVWVQRPTIRAQATFPRARLNAANINRTYSLINTEFMGGYPYLPNRVNVTNSGFQDLWGLNASEVEYIYDASTIINRARTFLTNNATKASNTIILSTYYCNDAYVVRAIS
jgi:type II secretory pathway pseudopilin PulG